MIDDYVVGFCSTGVFDRAVDVSKVEVVSNVLAGARFCVIDYPRGDSPTKGREAIARLIKQHGGQVCCCSCPANWTAPTILLL